MLNIGMDDIKVVSRDLGAILMYLSITFIIPIATAIFYLEPLQNIGIYVISALIMFFTGRFLKKIGNTRTETQVMHAMVTAALVWPYYTAISAMPLSVIGNIGPLDSFFEMMSAATTTGLSVIRGVEILPNSLLLWRSFVSWVGGIGIVILALSGVLKAYTKQVKLSAAEGREDRLRPNVRNTFKLLWSIYALLTLIGIILLMWFGMDAFNAINYSMSAISTTGMATSDGGLVDINSPAIEGVIMFIMIMGAIGFATHYNFLRRKDMWAYIKDKEVQLMAALIIITTILVIPAIGLREGIFHTVSALTCGGFNAVSIAAIQKWPPAVKILLSILMSIGGAVGSTAGGIKLWRVGVILKSLYWQVKRSILPEEAYFRKTLGDVELKDHAIHMIFQLTLIYILFLIIGTVVLTLDGANIGNAFFCVSSAQGNAGIPIGIVRPHMPIASELMLIINMWVGRLEIIPILTTIGFITFYKRRR